jgi:hypothetical protein
LATLNKPLFFSEKEKETTKLTPRSRQKTKDGTSWQESLLVLLFRRPERTPSALKDRNRIINTLTIPRNEQGLIDNSIGIPSSNEQTVSKNPPTHTQPTSQE